MSISHHLYTGRGYCLVVDLVVIFVERVKILNGRFFVLSIDQLINCTERSMASPLEKKLRYDVSEIEEAKALNVEGKIVKLSPVRTAKSRSRYFDGEMSDGKARKRFVSFDTWLRTNMERFFKKEEAVSLVNCDVKKSILKSADLEIITSTSTQVIKSEKKILSGKNRRL